MVKKSKPSYTERKFLKENEHFYGLSKTRQSLISNQLDGAEHYRKLRNVLPWVFLGAGMAATFSSPFGQELNTELLGRAFGTGFLTTLALGIPSTIINQAIIKQKLSKAKLLSYPGLMTKKIADYNKAGKKRKAGKLIKLQQAALQQELIA